jgi:hypothetical protein
MQTDSLQALAVTVAQAHSVDEVLKLVVGGLASQPHIALARIWLAAAADEFHLAASAGTPLDKKVDWSRLEGEFSRFRAGEKKVGHIGATGELPSRCRRSGSVRKISRSSPHTSSHARAGG